MCLAQFFQTWGSMISTLALVATLIVLIFYTVFTYQLRREAGKQTELSLRPFVIITIDDTLNYLFYKNIGHTSALDVETEPFDADAFLLKFEKWGLVEVGESKDLNIRGEVRGVIGDALIQSVSVPRFTPKALHERDSDLEIILNISYRNLENISYCTKVKISREGIEVLSTWKK